MKALALERLNQTSPYHVRACSEEGFYEFETVHGVQYSVGFMEDEELLPDEDSCTLIIANTNHQKSPRDRMVRDTILMIVEEFFVENAYTLLYICETGDGKQSMRGRLFSFWFASSAHQSRYTFLSTYIVDMDGVVNFAAMIIRNDNPRLVQVVAKFTEITQLLSDKPDR